jgi:5'-nucleotidase
MRILLSNDDGVYAPGLRILYEELKKLGSVKVVAPMEEMSTTGHSLSISKPLRLHEIGTDFYAVNGSPADCVSVGVQHILKTKPDIVVSGINRGANLGQDIYYSGTVSAAREASIMGIPSYAVSLCIDHALRRPEAKFNYRAAAKIALKIIKHYQKENLPKHTLMNINVPDRTLQKIKGILPARQGFRHYDNSILKRTDHRGKDYFWVGGQYAGFVKEQDTDCALVDKGYATITPLKLDVTDMAFLEEMKRLSE